MKLIGTGHLRRRVRRVWLRTQPRAVILMYHRVAEVPSDPQLLCVKPTNFMQHLAHLQRYYQLISLETLIDALKSGEVPHRAVVITFDDGYADNLYNAKPLLDRYEVPATVFVVGGKLDDTREFWWDELERLLLSPDKLPETLELNISGKGYAWDLKTPAGNEGSRPERYCSWNVAVQENPSPRHKVYRELHALLRPLEDTLWLMVLNELASQIGTNTTGRPEYRALTTDELRALVEGELVGVGAHTLTHPVLATLPPEVQQKEIEEGRQRLEHILQRPVTSFSYPYGGQTDYTPETVAIVRNAGFTCACSNFPGLVTKGSDPFQLPRHIVRDWDGDTFARWLKGIF